VNFDAFPFARWLSVPLPGLRLLSLHLSVAGGARATLIVSNLRIRASAPSAG